jgi:hypothetical protein
MRSRMTRERAALAVIEQALSRASATCAGPIRSLLLHPPLSRELEDLITHATEKRQRIVDAQCLAAAATVDQIENAERYRA